MNSMSVKITENLKNNILEILVCVFVFGTLAYCITADFNYDDVVYFYFRGREFLEECTFQDMLAKAQAAWVERGRFSPVALLWSYIIYYIFTDFQFYEIFLILFTILDVVIFGKMVEMFTKSKRYKLLAMLGVTLFFQVYTNYHNVLVGYAALLQLCVALTLLQLIFLHKYLQNGQLKYLVLSEICQVLSALVYEFCYFNILMVLCVLLFHKERTKKVLSILFTYSVPLFAMGTYSLHLNISSKVAGSIYNGSDARLDLSNMIVTWLKQIYAAVPLSHFMSYRKKQLEGNAIFYLDNPKAIINALNHWDVIILGLFLIIFFLIFLKYGNEHIEKPGKWLYCLALILFLSPSVLPAMTSKYQDELVWGVAHLAVFEQYFGLCLLVILLIMELSQQIQKFYKNRRWIVALRMFFFLGMAGILVVNMAVENIYIISLKNLVKFPRTALINAIEQDILEDVDEKDTLLNLQYMSWGISDFFSQYAGRKVYANTINRVYEEKKDKIQNQILEDQGLYALHTYGTNGTEMVALGSIENIHFDENGNAQIYNVNNIKIYCNFDFQYMDSQDGQVPKEKLQKLKNNIYFHSFEKPVDFYTISLK